MPLPLILDWHAAAAAGPRAAGGKGWNLGRLRRYGFPVPRGFVLSADAYRRFMEEPALRRLAAELAPVRAERAAAPEIAEKLAFLRTAMGAADWPAGVADAVRRGLAAAGLASDAVAVRSSATAEDGGSTSFAGVHLSVLEVSGPDAVLRAVRDVWASLWTPQALAYRRKMRVADEDAACAVVVCRMVQARVAGVAFTCDPKSGRRDTVAIGAAAGRGDAVVAGAVNPEEISVVLGRRGLAVERRTGPPCLDDLHALALARLALRVQAVLGDCQDPQDIEWAHDGKRFTLLQARPVTRAPRPSFPGAPDLPVVWSNANIKDSVPFVMTAMTWSCIQAALRFMMYQVPEIVGYPVPHGLEVVRRFAGRGYFDVSSLQYAFWDAFGARVADTNRAMGGHHEDIRVTPGNPFFCRKGLSRLRRVIRAARALLALPKTIPPAVLRVFDQSQELLKADVASLDDAGLLALLERVSLVQVEYSGPFMLSASALAWQAELEKAVEGIAPGRGASLAAALVAGTGDVVSAQHGLRLFEVAEAARRDPAALAFLGSGAASGDAWRSLPATSPFRLEFSRFLAEFGHRAVYEAEVATPRWNEDPSWLLEQVRAILDGRARRPDEAAREKRLAAEREVRRLTWLRRPKIFWLAKKAREGAKLREWAKSGLVAQVEPMRKLLLEVGRRLVRAAKCDRPDDVFHLAWVEVEMLLRGEWSGEGARAIAADGRVRMAAWERERPPDALREDGSSPAPPRRAPSGDGRVLMGIGASPGKAAGVARVVRHPAEGGRLGAGEILVAPSTDPGWTPLFLRAGGIAMEVGGMLSHGAIVAREYGLPAVVNVPALLERVKDGQRVEVDGDSGIVTVE